jgi:hypothetical protein
LGGLVMAVGGVILPFHEFIDAAFVPVDTIDVHFQVRFGSIFDRIVRFRFTAIMGRGTHIRCNWAIKKREEQK